MSLTITKDRFQINLRHGKALNLIDGVQFVASPKCGAINTFSGTIRDTDVNPECPGGKPESIEAIHYEAYESMLLKQLTSIIDSTIKELSDSEMRAYVAIRLGLVAVGEASVTICVSSTGRQASHKATMIILEKIKALATVWKKIVFISGQKEWASSNKSEAFWLKKSSNTSSLKSFPV